MEQVIDKKEVISTYNLGNRKTYKIVQESLEEYSKNNPSIDEVKVIREQFNELKKKVNDAIEKCNANNLKQDITDTGKGEIVKEIKKMNDLIKEYNNDMKEE